MKTYCFIIEENDEGTRLDNYLSGFFINVSRSKIQELIKNGKILVDGVAKKSSYNLKIKNKIELVQNDIMDANKDRNEIIEPQNILLDIVYEDESMLVINKPSGMLTHPTTIEREGTLVNALLYKYGENLSDINGDLRRGIVHRLDRNTSGLLMVAKTNEAHKNLASQIKERTVIKKYLAIVNGVIKDDFGTINLPIGRHSKYPKMAVIEEAKASVTDFMVISRFKDSTYLELDLKTGRTHQIRVHLSYLKHPILNDSLYGGANFKVKTQEQVLQSYKLTFTKPFCDDIINLEVEPDEKFKKVLAYLNRLKK